MIRFTAEIRPIGATAEHRLDSLVTQLRAQNEQLKAIFADVERQIGRLKQENAALRELVEKKGGITWLR